MSFRLRVTLAAGAATLVVVVAVSAAVYVLVRRDLRDQIDDSLGRNISTSLDLADVVRPDQVDLADRVPAGERFPFTDRFLQVVDSDGQIARNYTDTALPVTDEVVAAARGERSSFLYDDETADGTPVRVRVTSVGDGLAVQLGRSLDEVNESLRQLAVTLGAISAGAVGLALLLGRVVASAAVAPVHRLSDAADMVSRTGDLSHHITVPGRDELGRLAGSFNTMLDALESSLARQRQLVADASHELRTPLASVRTNVEVLQRGNGMQPAEREQLLGDVVAQIIELTRLVNDLVELARGEDDDEAFEPLSLERIVADVVDRARRNHPSLDFRVTASPTVVRGAPRRVERAVTNLIDNAAKWSPSGGRVDVVVGGGAVVVSDEGPGIDPADVPHVFDRFYRSARARSMPGSGLGLAIVKQVADSHGGTVSVDAARRGGARLVLRFPASSWEPSG
jgi:two-component system, OmpR family, sensor histidine kinase MprB